MTKYMMVVLAVSVSALAMACGGSEQKPAESAPPATDTAAPAGGDAVKPDDPAAAAPANPGAGAATPAAGGAEAPKN